MECLSHSTDKEGVHRMFGDGICSQMHTVIDLTMERIAHRISELRNLNQGLATKRDDARYAECNEPSCLSTVVTQ